MSHIPNAAMKHAGPVHHDPANGRTAAHDASATDRPGEDRGRIGTGAWIAIGGTLVAGAAAALAFPLLRARTAPVPSRRGKRAGVRKAKTAKGASKTGG